MTSLKTKIAITTLTNALARAVYREAGRLPSYLRLRLTARDFTSRSPEIGYLDANSRARFVPRGLENFAAESIAALALEVAKAHASSDAHFNTPSATFELEAVEIGRWWRVSITVTHVDSQSSRNLQYSSQHRVLREKSVTALAA